ncbi:23S rRNA (pseudouridine(1915)-N(3))-methyltransferase RlmH [Brytella acorum]|uniref:Ribosomal RNA large subunit methyltransferase H n=1 Tax=Brytella acorum TaxID=2959299 RepID=A0AA35V3E4_9PROT|nr:23S rRNA (pseudouridine(1915)-N(3))-methyltransferase RlmH [Brytella acorum]MDF3625936.1 23S rRNA (pseudouridine(1915)-N(3))-methyltransferase RlmH [Brytella acorum]CAI9121841.1 23S rRNA (pseudouridine(1915)-N(3))-methyltransferase RlmH [Brytella acorum]
MRLIAVGRMKASPERDLFERYAGRIRPRLDLTELAESKGSAAEVRRRDATALLACCPANALVIALDEGGATPDSGELSRMLERWTDTGRPLHFLIGGAEGLENRVIDRADATLSLGRLTWPHMLVRGLLAEQLYRAQCISTGHPYHRSARP